MPLTYILMNDTKNLETFRSTDYDEVLRHVPSPFMVGGEDTHRIYKEAAELECARCGGTNCLNDDGYCTKPE